MTQTACGWFWLKFSLPIKPIMPSSASGMAETEDASQPKTHSTVINSTALVSQRSFEFLRFQCVFVCAASPTANLILIQNPSTARSCLICCALFTFPISSNRQVESIACRPDRRWPARGADQTLHCSIDTYCSRVERIPHFPSTTQTHTRSFQTCAER